MLSDRSCPLMMGDGSCCRAQLGMNTSALPAAAVAPSDMAVLIAFLGVPRIILDIFGFGPFDDAYELGGATAPVEPETEPSGPTNPGGGNPGTGWDPDGGDELAPNDPRRERELEPA